MKLPELESGFDFTKGKTYTLGINKPNKIIVHHTGGTDKDHLADSSNFTFAQCDAFHKKFGLKSSLGYYCGYHYYIEKSGKIYQARAHVDEGAHTVGQNNQSIGICIAGNFDATSMTDAQVEAFKSIVVMVMKRWNIPASEIRPHRHFASKTCNGRKLRDTWGTNTAKIALANEKKKLAAEIALLDNLNK